MGFRSPTRICPLVEIGVRVETGIVVVDPSNVGFVELLEDGALRETENMECEVVCSVSMGRARGDVRATEVSLRWVEKGTF